MRRLTAMGLLAGVLALAGCGDKGPTPPTAAAIQESLYGQTCTLGEAEAALSPANVSGFELLETTFNPKTSTGTASVRFVLRADSPTRVTGVVSYEATAGSTFKAPSFEVTESEPAP
jgi:hypothetical protein